jgi:hypothetical protein
MKWVYFLMFFSLIILTILWLDDVAKKKAQRLNKIKSQYFESLNSGNKKYALECGRLYYSSLRGGGILSVYDEAALANDLAAMDVKNN